MNHYKAILFDADGTLLDYERAESFALKQSFVSLKIRVNDADILELYRRINGRLWREFELGSINADDVKIERFRRLLTQSGIAASADELSNAYLQKLEEAGFLIPGAKAVLRELRSTSRLSLVTNGFSRVQRSRLSLAGITGYFEHIIISEEVGSQKPEPEIFTHSMKLLAPINRDEVLFVGDSLASDIKGGNDAGIDTCWYNPMKKERGREIIPRFEIARLEDIAELVDQPG